ncbi:hypothetical protein OSB04_031948 [Centaurea solstitialis]|uniref:Uncharacterized protein n=1 Tax=Centaurea solstitialis TaxID=347529 RepID=A0AA38SN37_9ASTR|nr:hypothetical protein OSB04_031948 [Centaurea solstitialis]
MVDVSHHKKVLTCLLGLENMSLDVKNVKKKKRVQEMIESKKGALDKFVIKESEAFLNNEDTHVDLNDAHIDAIEVDATNVDSCDIDATNVDACDTDATNIDACDIDGTDMNATNVDASNMNATNVDDNVEATNVDASVSLDAIHDNVNASIDDTFNNLDIFDPRNWDVLDSKMIDILVAKGPKRDLSIQKGPKDRFSKRFLPHGILEFCQMEKSLIETGLYIRRA